MIRDGRRQHRVARNLPGSIRRFISPQLTAGAEFLGAAPDLASTIASVAAPALTGAGVGALGSALAGGKPLTGALLGGGIGAVGGLTGAAGALGRTLGLTDAGNSIADTLGISQTMNPSDLLIDPANPNSGFVTPPMPPQLDAGGNPIAGTGGATAVNTAAGQSPLAAEAGALTSGTGAGSAAGAGGAGAAPQKGIGGTSLALGALAALGSMLNKPKIASYPTPGPSSVAANTGPTFNAPLNTNVPGRTAMQPTTDWYTYGQRPEQSFFTGNALSNYGWGAPPPVAAAHGGALHAAHGGREFSTDDGERFVQGPGTGTSDSVPARLSDGEYVLTSADVNRIGGGSNDRGAAILDHDRGALAKALGEKKFVRQKLRHSAHREAA